MLILLVYQGSRQRISHLCAPLQKLWHMCLKHGSPLHLDRQLRWSWKCQAIHPLPALVVALRHSSQSLLPAVHTWEQFVLSFAISYTIRFRLELHQVCSHIHKASICLSHWFQRWTTIRIHSWSFGVCPSQLHKWLLRQISWANTVSTSVWRLHLSRWCSTRWFLFDWCDIDIGKCLLDRLSFHYVLLPPFLSTQTRQNPYSWIETLKQEDEAKWNKTKNNIRDVWIYVW